MIGTVQSGFGAASNDQPPYPVDWKPVPGTLNVKLDRPLGLYHTWIPFATNPIACWYGRLGDIEVLVTRPVRAVHLEDDDYEIVAPVHLRDKFKFKDGDTVEVHVSDVPFEILKPTGQGTAVVPGRSYHAIPGIDSPSDRGGTEKRVAQIAKALRNVSGVSIVDLGCSVGGVSIGLADRGAIVHGIDSDLNSIRVAEAAARQLSVPVTFECGDLTDDKVWRGVLDGEYDVAVWLSNWMWVAKQAGREKGMSMLADLSQKVPTLIFETATQRHSSMAGTGGVEDDSDVEKLLQATGWVPKKLGPSADGWHSRTVFIAKSAT